MKQSTRYLARFATVLTMSGFAVFFSVYMMLATANAPCHNIPSASSVTEAISTHPSQRGNAKVDALCNRDSQQITWVTWLFKKPESAQFHYVDLLELLSRQK